MRCISQFALGGIFFFAIPPRLLVSSKGISQCHFLLGRIRVCVLKYISYNILTRAVHLRKISFQTAFRLAALFTLSHRDDDICMHVSSLIGSLFLNLSESTCSVFHKKPPMLPRPLRAKHRRGSCGLRRCVAYTVGAKNLSDRHTDRKYRLL